MALTKNCPIYCIRKLPSLYAASRMYICRHLSMEVSHDTLIFEGLSSNTGLPLWKSRASSQLWPSVTNYSCAPCTRFSTYKALQSCSKRCNVDCCSSSIYSNDYRHRIASSSATPYPENTVNASAYLLDTIYTKPCSHNLGSHLSFGKHVNSLSLLFSAHTHSQQLRTFTSDSTSTTTASNREAIASKPLGKNGVGNTESIGTSQGLGLLGRRPVKKKSVTPAAVKTDVFPVIAMATAEEYDLERLRAAIENQALYTIQPLPKDDIDALHVRASYTLEETEEPREIFFFRQGCVVFWNLPEVEKNEMLMFLRKHTDDNYDARVILHEAEKMDYAYTTKTIDLVGDTFQINKDENVLSKYAFSNAMSSSVKLAIWEASLENFVQSIEPVLEDLKFGRKIRISRQHVLQKTGELFTLRHLINLSSDLLDLPDFYWDRESLETLYQKTCTHLNVYRRTTVINEKLSHCCDLTELLTDHLSDSHHVRLEWMIILLILIEVIFELVPYFEEYFLKGNVQKADESTNE